MSDDTGGALPSLNETGLPTASAERALNGQFAAGNGYSSGRRKGSRNRAKVMAEAMLDGEVELLSRKMIDMAKSGDFNALRFCLERIVPRATPRPSEMELPPVETQDDVLAAHTAVIAAACEGEIDPAHGERLARMLELKRKSLESVAFERRLDAVEAKVAEANAAVRGPW